MQPVWDDDVMAEGYDPRQPHYSIGHAGPSIRKVGSLASRADTTTRDVPLRAVGGSEAINRAEAINRSQRSKSGGSNESGDWTKPSTLPPFDASNGLLNARQHFDAAYARRWEAHRKAVFSELHFKVRSWLWAFLIEILPVFIAAPMVALWSGVDEAKNRSLLPYTPAKLMADILTSPMIVYTSFGFWLFARDVLPQDAVYELVGVALFVFGRAATLGVKYACYPDLTLNDTTDSLNIKGPGYEQGKIRDKAQMATYVINATGMQKIQLCNLLYKSCLYVDTDLSAAYFHIRQCPESLTAEKQVTAIQMWEYCLDELSEVYTSEEPETGNVISPTGADGQKLFTLSKDDHCCRLKSVDSQEEEEEEEEKHKKLSHEDSAADIEAMHKNATNSDVHLVDPGKQAEHMEDGLMLATFFRSRNRDITALAKRGKIPATVVALNLVFRCFERTQKQGLRIMLGIFICALSLGFSPPFFRMMVGKTPFGDTPREIAFRVWLCWAQSPGFFLIFFFNLAPCLWYFSKLQLARELHSMLAGMDDCYTCGGNVKVVWSPQTDQAKDMLPRFEVDLRCCEDVAAWAALRQVLHGGNFGPVIHRKFQMYGTVMFAIFLAMPTVQALGSFYTDPGDGTKAIQVDVKILSILRMMLLAIPTIVQVLIAYKVNQYTGYQEEAIFRMQRANMALSATLRGRGDEAEEQADKLDRCQALLGAVADEIRSSEESSPMRVMGLVAKPSVVISIVSIMTSLIVLEVRELGIVPFLS